MPEKITIDRSGANTAAIVSMQADSGLPIKMRQSKYLTHLIEQDHRAVKRITRPMLGFKSFRCARILIMAARALGLDSGAMSGFDNAGVDTEFFAGTTYKSNFLVNLGYGDPSVLFPRSPRFAFDEIAKII